MHLAESSVRFVLYALIALKKCLFYDDSKILLFSLVLCLAEVHEYRNKRRLSVCGKQGYNLILDSLHTAAYLLAQATLHNLGKLLVGNACAERVKLLAERFSYLLAADLNKRREMRERNALPAVLVARNLRDYLCSDIAGS